MNWPGKGPRTLRDVVAACAFEVGGGLGFSCGLRWDLCEAMG